MTGQSWCRSDGREGPIELEFVVFFVTCPHNSVLSNIEWLKNAAKSYKSSLCKYTASSPKIDIFFALAPFLSCPHLSDGPSTLSTLTTRHRDTVTPSPFMLVCDMCMKEVSASIGSAVPPFCTFMNRIKTICIHMCWWKYLSFSIFHHISSYFVMF